MAGNEATTAGVKAFIALARPREWVKNVFVFAALVFAGRTSDPVALLLTVEAFAAFCLLSSACYVINDIADAKQDRQHPTKRNRPIASGRITATQGVILALFCLGVGAAVCAAVNVSLLAVGLLYVALSLLYTCWLKRHVLIDVMCIAAGFVLRAVGGGAAIGAPVSLWLVACTFTLCMFLGFCKRRCELAELAGREPAASCRPALLRYSLPLLDRLIGVSAGVAIVTYLLYTVAPHTIEKAGTPCLIFSVPLVIYCIFRIALLVEAGRTSGPTEVITQDKPFIFALLLWVAYVVGVVAWGRRAALLGEGISRILEW